MMKKRWLLLICPVSAFVGAGALLINIPSRRDVGFKVYRARAESMTQMHFAREPGPPEPRLESEKLLEAKKTCIEAAHAFGLTDSEYSVAQRLARNIPSKLILDNGILWQKWSELGVIEQIKFLFGSGSEQADKGLQSSLFVDSMTARMKPKMHAIRKALPEYCLERDQLFW